MAETSSLLRNHTHYAYRGFESLPLRHYSLVVAINNLFCACVAQLDRVPGYEPGGRRFESSQPRHIKQKAPPSAGLFVSVTTSNRQGSHNPRTDRPRRRRPVSAHALR